MLELDILMNDSVTGGGQERQSISYLVDVGSCPYDSSDQRFDDTGYMRQDINSVFPISKRTTQCRRKMTLFALALPRKLRQSWLWPEGFLVYLRIYVLCSVVGSGIYDLAVFCNSPNIDACGSV